MRKTPIISAVLKAQGIMRQFNATNFTWIRYSVFANPVKKLQYACAPLFKVLPVLLFTSVIGNPAISQCTISGGGSTGPVGGTVVLGQTFTPVCTGDISYVTIKVPVNVNVAYGYLASIKTNCTGTSLGSASTAGNVSTGVNTIIFPTPVHVEAGTTYALEFTADVEGQQVYYSLGSNNYAGGSYYLRQNATCYFNYVGDYDVIFSINYVDEDSDGYSISQGDCNDANAAINPGATEVCDGIDNNCNGQIDEGALTTYYRDADGDGFGDPALSQQGCSSPEGYVANNTDCNDGSAVEKPGQVWYKDADNDGHSNGATTIGCDRPTGYKLSAELIRLMGDCNDNNATVYYTAPEICDGQDNDCNGVVDDGIVFITYYRDLDGDGYGTPNSSIQNCAVIAGYVTNNNDCNDFNPTVYLNAPEICDGLDNNCNGTVDEGVTTTFYRDADFDGYGNPAVTIQGCNPTPGYVANSADCNDGNNAINPNAIEVCDGVDNNCNGQIDEGLLTTFYRDADGDGFGDPGISQQTCSKPAGYVDNSSDCNDANVLERPGQLWYKDSDNDGFTESGSAIIIACIRPAGYKTGIELAFIGGDCNDGNASINPNASEICDGVDNNCNGQMDEGVINTFYLDEDGDGSGNQNISIQGCSAPNGYVNNTGDCNDNNPTIYFNAPEICDGLDNNCNGVVDDGVVTTTFYRDADSDGAGDPTVSVQGCSAPTGYVTNSTDCNDAIAAINPGATEICDGMDNNCNGTIDEGCNITTCGIITDLSTTNITSTSARLNWVASVNPTQWLIQYKTVAPGAKWKNVTPSPAPSDRTVVITGLSANQSYLWHIKARCGKTWTTYYESVAFKTLAGTSMLVKSNYTSMPTAIEATALKLYPNPSNGKVTIELRVTENGSGTAKLELVDMKGRIVFMTNAYILNGALQKNIDLAPSLSSGIYTVKITAGNYLYFSKLVYNK